MKFFLLLELHLRWKYFVLESPNIRLVILELCFFLARSKMDKPMTRCFNWERSSLSSAVRVRFSYAMSRRRIISRAMCSCSLAPDNNDLLHSRRRLAVLCSLKFSLHGGSVCGLCSVQDICTTSLKPGILIQKFSNLKCFGCGGPLWFERSSGHTSMADTSKQNIGLFGRDSTRDEIDVVLQSQKLPSQITTRFFNFS